MSDVYIYALRDPNTNEVRYIGKANNVESRFRQHIQNKDKVNRHKHSWIDNLKRAGLQPDLLVLEITDDKHWEDRERYWIKFGMDCGWSLTNISSGGAVHFYQINPDWDSAIWSYLPEDEWLKFKTLSADKKFEVCRRVAAKLMEYSWVAIKSRGGNPEKEYDREKQYWAGSNAARSLLTLYGT